MRAMLVVVLHKGIELHLQCRFVRRRLFAQGMLERAVHPLVATVLLWLALSMRSGLMPSLIHHIARRDRPATPVVANGGPLSLRMRSGSPYCRNTCSKLRLASS
nr:hypothetical protein [Delftia tsuruhatensis]